MRLRQACRDRVSTLSYGIKMARARRRVQQAPFISLRVMLELAYAASLTQNQLTE
jgi:hypothetical protein